MSLESSDPIGLLFSQYSEPPEYKPNSDPSGLADGIWAIVEYDFAGLSTIITYSRTFLGDHSTTTVGAWTSDWTNKTVSDNTGRVIQLDYPNNDKFSSYRIVIISINPPPPPLDKCSVVVTCSHEEAVYHSGSGSGSEQTTVTYKTVTEKVRLDLRVVAKLIRARLGY